MKKYNNMLIDDITFKRDGSIDDSFLIDVNAFLEYLEWHFDNDFLKYDKDNQYLFNYFVNLNDKDILLFDSYIILKTTNKYNDIFKQFFKYWA